MKKQTIRKPPLSRTAGGMPRELLSTDIKGKIPRLYIVMFPNCGLKMHKKRRTAGRLLIPSSGTRRVRWKMKRALPAITPAKWGSSLAIVWLGKVARVNPWYAVYLFHHQRRGSDLHFSTSQHWTIILRRHDYLLTLRPPGIVASYTESPSVTEIHNSGSSYRQVGGSNPRASASDMERKHGEDCQRRTCILNGNHYLD